MARKSDIRLRRSNVANAVPGGADLNEGELAINTADGALYFLVAERLEHLRGGGARGGGGVAARGHRGGRGQGHLIMCIPGTEGAADKGRDGC